MALKYNISYEVASTIFLVIMLCFFKLQYDTNSKLNNEFRKLVWFGLMATILDVTTAITISFESVVPIGVNTVLNTVYFISVAVLGYRLAFYNYLYVYKNTETSKIIRFNQIAIVLFAVFLIFNLFSGISFSFTEDGGYVKGPAHMAVYIAAAYFVFCSAGIVVCNLRKFRMWQRISLSIFVFFQVSGIVLQMVFFPEVLLALFMSALGLMMILFTLETPDYQKLVSTIDELSATKKMAEVAKEEADKAKVIAQQANRAKSDFLANMSHEIRTPLNSIVGFSSLLTSDQMTLSKEEKAHFSDIIKQNSDALLNLINDVLDLSRIETGRMAIKKEDCDIVALSKSVMESMIVTCRKTISFDFRCDFPEFVISTDEARLRQVIVNLVTNSIKFSEQGSIVLAISKNDNEGMLYFSVTDNGCGIPEKDAVRVFERFVKLDQFKQGTGLGLQLCQQFVTRLGGKIWVDTSYKDGARFVFTHPI